MPKKAKRSKSKTIEQKDQKKTQKDHILDRPGSYIGDVEKQNEVIDPFNDENRLQINVAICGAVSAGKSTLLNSLFVSQYSDMKIKRTTMTPQVYFETNNVPNNYLIKNIRHENKVINDFLIKKTENQEVININNIKETKYIVPRVHKLVTLKDNVFLTIYDIPGLNDGRTKDAYFKYLTSNFYKFDIILFIVDIYSSLNTSDEVDILETIIKNAKNNYDTYGIHNKLIILANKCDDLFIGENKSFKLDEELDEMYKQIEKVVSQKVQTHFKELEYSILPLSSEDSFIYRMYDRNPDYNLDIKHINKFGFNEYGKSRWNRLSVSSKKTKIKSLMKDININETLYLTGFNNFKLKLQDYLKDEYQYKYLVNHILYGLKQIDSNDVLDINDDINKFFKYYLIFEKLNKSFNHKNTDQFEDILEEYLEGYLMKTIRLYIGEDGKIINQHCVVSVDAEVDKIKKIKKIFDRMATQFIFSQKVEDINLLVTNSLNDYYVTNIKERKKSVTTIFSYLTNLFNYGYKITKELIVDFFGNNDMITSKTSKEIIQYIENLESKKIIESKDKIEILMQIMVKVYQKLAFYTRTHTGISKAVLQLNENQILKYVYLINIFWFNKSNHITDKYYTEQLHLGMLATKAQYVWFNLVAPNKFQETDLEDSLVLEKYLYEIGSFDDFKKCVDDDKLLDDGKLSDESTFSSGSDLDTDDDFKKYVDDGNLSDELDKELDLVQRDTIMVEMKVMKRGDNIVSSPVGFSPRRGGDNMVSSPVGFSPRRVSQ